MTHKQHGDLISLLYSLTLVLPASWNSHHCICRSTAAKLWATIPHACLITITSRRMQQ